MRLVSSMIARLSPVVSPPHPCRGERLSGLVMDFKKKVFPWFKD